MGGDLFSGLRESGATYVEPPAEREVSPGKRPSVLGEERQCAARPSHLDSLNSSIGTVRHKVRQIRNAVGFIVSNPAAALKIGPDPGWGVDGITAQARRMSEGVYDYGEGNFDLGPGGTFANAFRHALWQAAIAARFGDDMARKAGDAHESDPQALVGVADVTAKVFRGIDAAFEVDTATDMLNNESGRRIGRTLPRASMLALAQRVLEVFHQEGLWMAHHADADGVSIRLTRLSDEQYAEALGRLGTLDASGRKHPTVVAHR